MSHELPRGWVSIELEDHVYIAGRIGWRGLKRSEYTKSGPLFLSVKNIRADGTIDFAETDHISKERYDESPEIQLRVNDILLTKDGTIGKVGMVGDLTCATTVNSSILVVRPKDKLLLARYLFYFLRGPQFQAIAHERITGSAIPHLFQKDIKKLNALVPPPAEQLRITAKLEQLLAKVNDCQHRLERIPLLLRRFRQSVLACAYSGRLTADWRNDNPGATSATSQIRNERFRLLRSKDDLPDLPETWDWVALGNHARCFRGRFTPRPRNDPQYFGGKHPFIQIGNLPREGGLVDSHTQTLNDRGLAASRRFPKGTVVIAIVGATIGNTGILAYDMCVTDSLVGIETGTEEGNRYVELFLRHAKNDIRQASYSSGGQPNIKLEFLNPYPLPLPPLAEQREIVRRVESLFALADQIQTQYEEGRKRVNSLAQSVLAKAFRGELVPAEADLAKAEGRSFESAEELLERIRQKDAHCKDTSDRVSRPRSPRLRGRGAVAAR